MAAGLRFDDALAAVPAVADRLRGAGPASDVRGAGPLRQRSTARGVGRVLLVGDASGYVDALTGENEFLPIRMDSRWNKVVEAVRANRQPCTKDPIYRQFDYWLGEWDVEVSGQIVARSSIQMILGECTVYENYWRLDGSYAGKSFSLWDAQQSRWEQRYVDTTGASRDWFGKLEGERMVFYLRPDANGGSGVQRMIYTKEGPDKVRQTIEGSTDGEKTWTGGFDGLYIRKK